MKTRVTIIVPYRNREIHMNQFIDMFRKYFIDLNSDFTLVFVEQYNEKPFNRGKLLNVGMKEFYNKTEYFINHDIDILPNMDCIKNIYDTHNLDYDVTRIFSGHDTSCGGLIKFHSNILSNMNGYPNDIWGWGIEDRAFYYRCKYMNMKLSPRYNSKFSFNSLNHTSNSHVYTKEKQKQSELWSEKFLDQLSKDELSSMININGFNDVEYHIINRYQKDNNIVVLKVDI